MLTVKYAEKSESPTSQASHSSCRNLKSQQSPKDSKSKLCRIGRGDDCKSPLWLLPPDAETPVPGTGANLQG